MYFNGTMETDENPTEHGFSLFGSHGVPNRQHTGSQYQMSYPPLLPIFNEVPFSNN